MQGCVLEKDTEGQHTLLNSWQYSIKYVMKATYNTLSIEKQDTWVTSVGANPAELKVEID